MADPNMLRYLQREITFSEWQRLKHAHEKVKNKLGINKQTKI